MTLLVAVLHLLLFTLLKSSEVVLDQEGRVEFANGYLVVAWEKLYLD